MKPVIGLSCYRNKAQWGVWDTEAVLLPTTYTRSVELAGGIPILLPPPQDPGDHADAVVARIDGLIITGGPDVDPARYGADRHPQTDQPGGVRDAWELALLDAADRISLPVLGICRGLQVLAVHAGGTLQQHLPDQLGHQLHSPGGADYGTVEVIVEPKSRVASLVGDRLQVSCHHHQAVAEHPGLQISARSADGAIEALEADGERFRLGVQWHPEERDDAGLFGGLIKAAAR
ncbi:gamma-glutamyl-gamma-aminobutyrate hydrolase family protein [Microlunatus elymi]|uniref:Gamma-glutamyl-gamma-aminobutyrate hydrolase family protein n=1 Tax=Microlunatus elymi TaxID=2596828 RepID=A0A516Q5C7_9ACTN|nr:gamma-glutamyl-gamma-aminobutyrate hydrolase family protein [Microlunatus elymi]QDP98646.1 gamma-glutamyl-gamma-aminobutyrate hydrolase family protein [Microlunatus elymi]